MHMDPLMPHIAGAALAIVVIGLVLRRFGQPLVVAYLLAGVALGPQGIGLVDGGPVFERMGAFGVLLLLFFAGMEISPRALIQRWRVAVLGTGLQIGISIGCVALVGAALDWGANRVVLLGCVISLSSTAVVLKVLRQGRDVDEEVGRDVVAVLLAQDLAVVPMLIGIGLLAGTGPGAEQIVLQVLGAIGAAALIWWVARRERFELPFVRALDGDPELQVFVALLVCSGFAVVASLLHLSAALGTFLAGIVVGAAQETRRFHEHLKPFEVVFVAIFFVSVGLLIDLDFMRDEWVLVLGLVLVVLAANTGINAFVLRLLGRSWRQGLVGASFLAQVGEFSFVLALVGHQSGIIGDFGYQTTLAVISVSLLVSPLWIFGVARALRERA
ncbi:MAG: cation:proton antiporter [Planctomycetota bacterium]